MNNVRIMHTGDLHLGLEFKNTNFDSEFANKRRAELWDILKKIIDRCNEKFIDILLIAGDLYEEEYFSISDMKRLSGVFRLLEKTEVVITAGNHDLISKKSLYTLVDWPKNVHIIKEGHLNKIEFEELNTVVWGLSWHKKEEHNDLITDVKIEDNKKINILLAHGDIYNKKSKYMPIDANKLKKIGFNYVALGHIHKHAFIEENIAYSGSPEPLDSGETGEHGVIEGSINLERVDLSFIPISKRQFIKIGINIDETLSYYGIIDKIVNVHTEEKRLKNLYTITLKGLIDRDISIDEAMMRDIAENFTYIKIIDETQVDLDIEKLYTDNRDNIIGLFIKEMQRTNLNNKINKKALYQGLKTLLSEKVNS